MSHAAVLLLAGLMVMAGCQHAPPEPHGESFMVTFEVDDFSEPLAGGSQRAYHAGSLWSAPLHTRVAVREFARDNNLVQLDAWPMPMLNLYCVLFTAPRGVDLPDLLTTLRSDTRVAGVQLNHQFEGMLTTQESYNDPLFELQYGARAAAALRELHAVTSGQRVRVGVIDSHVDLEHPDLKGQVFRQRAFVHAGDTEERVHGTAVTGVIGAAADNGIGLVGIAPSASLYVYGACKRDGTRTLCSSYDLARALVHAIEDNVDVLNMSLAGPEDTLLGQLLTAAIERGTIVIAAANQDAERRGFPATLAGTHAADSDAELWFAKGERLSTQAGGGYQVFYGSSVSAAGVAGVAALLRSRASAEESDELLRYLLTATCTEDVRARVHRVGLPGLCN